MASGSAWTSGREGALILRSSPRPPNSQQGGSLPFLFHRRGGMGTKRSARQAPQSPLRRDREGANQAQVSHHRRPPALQGYGDSMRATPVLQAFSSRKGSTAVQIPEDWQPSAHRPAISPSSHRPRDGTGAGRGQRLDQSSMVYASGSEDRVVIDSAVLDDKALDRWIGQAHRYVAAPPPK
jgi:hypothetical protein